MQNFRKNLMLVGAGGPGALQTSPEWAETVLERNFPTSAVRGRERGGILNFRGEMLLAGTGGPGALQTSPPVKRPSRAASFSALRPFGPYIAGLRPATPQSPERLRSTPFDCVAIAPCCFAKRKAVLSHALAALTALVPARRQSIVEIQLAALTALRFPCAVKAVEICFAALTALRFPCAVKAVEICFAALTALKAREKTEPLRELAALSALNKSAGQAVETLPNGGEHHSPGETASSAVAEETTPRLRKAVGVSPVYRRNTVEK